MIDEKVTQKNDNIEINFTLGMITAALGAVVGLLVYPFAFNQTFYPLIEVETAKGVAGCQKNVEQFYPQFTDMGLLSGILCIVAIYGFSKRNKWTLPFLFAANTLALKGSFWTMVPPMNNGDFPYYVFAFIPSLVLFFVNTKFVANLPWNRIIFGTLIGMAMITSFMNGIASTNRIDAIGPPDNWIYILVQRINIYAGLTMGVVVVGILLVPQKEWVKVVALVAGTAELFAGFPVAITYSLAVGRPAMFFMGPGFTIIMLIIIFFAKIGTDDQRTGKLGIYYSSTKGDPRPSS